MIIWKYNTWRTMYHHRNENRRKVCQRCKNNKKKKLPIARKEQIYHLSILKTTIQSQGFLVNDLTKHSYLESFKVTWTETSLFLSETRVYHYHIAHTKHYISSGQRDIKTSMTVSYLVYTNLEHDFYKKEYPPNTVEQLIQENIPAPKL